MHDCKISNSVLADFIRNSVDLWYLWRTYLESISFHYVEMLNFLGSFPNHISARSFAFVGCNISPEINLLFLFTHSVMSDSVTLGSAAHQASLSFTISWSLLKLMAIESLMPSNHLFLHCSLLLPSIFPSIRVFSNELVLCIRWPKKWPNNYLSTNC